MWAEIAHNLNFLMQLLIFANDYQCTPLKFILFACKIFFRHTSHCRKYMFAFEKDAAGKSKTYRKFFYRPILNAPYLMPPTPKFKACSSKKSHLRLTKYAIEKEHRNLHLPIYFHFGIHRINYSNVFLRFF